MCVCRGILFEGVMEFRIRIGKRNGFDLYFKIAVCLMAILCVFIAIADEKISAPYWVLTVNYAIFIVCSRYNFLKNTPGMLVLNIVMFCRYMVIPFAYYLTGEQSQFARNHDHLVMAAWLMVYEQLAVMLAIVLSGRYQKAREQKWKTKDKLILYGSRYGAIIAIASVLLLALIVYKNPVLVGGFELITQGEISNQAEEVDSGIVIMLWQACSAWLYIYWCFQIKRKYPRHIMPVLLLSLGYLLLIFIGQTRISRWYSMISFAAMFYVLMKLYPNKIKQMVVMVCIPVLAVFLVVSIYKNTDFLTESNASFQGSVKELLDVSVLDPYFAGPCNVNNSIGLYQDWGVNISCLKYDIVNNMPMVNHWIHGYNASVHQYNMYIGRWWGSGGDNIIPLLGQSMVYFTPLFAPLLSVLSVFLVRYFDRKYLQSNSYFMFFYAFTAAWTGAIMVLNLTIYLSWIYARIIPLYLLMLFIQYLGMRKVQVSKALQ